MPSKWDTLEAIAKAIVLEMKRPVKERSDVQMLIEFIQWKLSKISGATELDKKD